jgi:hypothetical protein
VLVASLACAWLTGCADLYVVFEQVELRDDARVPHGGGCALVLQRGGLFGSSSGVSSGGASAGENDLTVDEGERGDRYVVVVSSFGDELAYRSYDRAFLNSHKVDTFQVTTSRGKRFEFSYHGSRECESPPPLEDPPDASSTTRPDAGSATRPDASSATLPD